MHLSRMLSLLSSLQRRQLFIAYLCCQHIPSLNKVSWVALYWSLNLMPRALSSSWKEGSYPPVPPETFLCLKSSSMGPLTSLTPRKSNPSWPLTIGRSTFQKYSGLSLSSMNLTSVLIFSSAFWHTSSFTRTSSTSSGDPSMVFCISKTACIVLPRWKAPTMLAPKKYFSLMWSSVRCQRSSKSAKEKLRGALKQLSLRGTQLQEMLMTIAGLTSIKLETICRGTQRLGCRTAWLSGSPFLRWTERNLLRKTTSRSCRMALSSGTAYRVTLMSGKWAIASSIDWSVVSCAIFRRRLQSKEVISWSG